MSPPGGAPPKTDSLDELVSGQGGPGPLAQLAHLQRGPGAIHGHPTPREQLQGASVQLAPEVDHLSNHCETDQLQLWFRELLIAKTDVSNGHKELSTQNLIQAD